LLSCFSKKNVDLKSKNGVFLVVLFFILGYIVTTALILKFYFGKAFTVDFRMMQLAGSLVFFFMGMTFSVYFYKRFFLKKLNLEPSFYSKKYLIFASASLALFVDFLLKGMFISKGEYIFIATIFYVSNLLHFKKFEKIILSKDRFILFLSKTFSSAFLYLIFVIIFSIASDLPNYIFDIKNLSSSMFSILPNILRRMLIIFPILIFFSIPIIFTGSKIKNPSYPEILDEDF